MNPLERVHEGYVVARRSRVLCGHLVPLMPASARVLDVGCGDGRIAALLKHARPDLTLEGVDVAARPDARIPVRVFDGQTLPAAAGSVDVVMLVDVLHHAADPLRLLREAARVARRAVVLKDHTREGLFAQETLSFMDWVGNARHGVARPQTYWSKRQWLQAAADLGLTVGEWRQPLGLYPWPASLLFERSLHFIARLDVAPSRSV